MNFKTKGRYTMKGFTVIELIIAVFGVAIISLIVFLSVSSGSNNVSFGINGITETRCIGGFKFVIGDRGRAEQILDSNGKGISCN